MIAVSVGVLLPNDRKRFAPITLTAEKPVAQLVMDAALAFAVLLQPFDHLGLGFGGGKAVENSGIYRRSILWSRRVEVGVEILGLSIHHQFFHLMGTLEVTTT